MLLTSEPEKKFANVLLFVDNSWCFLVRACVCVRNFEDLKIDLVTLPNNYLNYKLKFDLNIFLAPLSIFERAIVVGVVSVIIVVVTIFVTVTVD